MSTVQTNQQPIIPTTWRNHHVHCADKPTAHHTNNMEEPSCPLYRQTNNPSNQQHGGTIMSIVQTNQQPIIPTTWRNHHVHCTDKPTAHQTNNMEEPSCPLYKQTNSRSNQQHGGTIMSIVQTNQQPIKPTTWRNHHVHFTDKPTAHQTNNMEEPSCPLYRQTNSPSNQQHGGTIMSTLQTNQQPIKPTTWRNHHVHFTDKPTAHQTNNMEEPSCPLYRQTNSPSYQQHGGTIMSTVQTNQQHGGTIMSIVQTNQQPIIPTTWRNHHVHCTDKPTTWRNHHVHCTDKPTADQTNNMEEPSCPLYRQTNSPSNQQHGGTIMSTLQTNQQPIKPTTWRNHHVHFTDKPTAHQTNNMEEPSCPLYKPALPIILTNLQYREAIMSTAQVHHRYNTHTSQVHHTYNTGTPQVYHTYNMVFHTFTN